MFFLTGLKVRATASKRKKIKPHRLRYAFYAWNPVSGFDLRSFDSAHAVGNVGKKDLFFV